MRDHLIVVGAGVFGVPAAIELRARGYRVSLVDPGPIPHEQAASTDISKVVRLDYGSDLIYTAMMEQALPMWRAYNQRWSRPLFHESGFCLLTATSMDEGGYEYESYQLLTSRGHTLERLDRGAIHERYPSWRAGAYVDGYYNPQGGWAESGAVIRALLQQASGDGVAIVEGQAVRELIENTGRVQGVVLESGECIEGDGVVVAAGAWTPKLLPELASHLQAVGQPVFHFRPSEIAPFQAPRFVPWAADIGTTGWYGFCDNGQGVVKVANHGPGFPIDPAAERLMPEACEGKFRFFLREALPVLSEAPVVYQRLCLYCDSLDGDLWIDRHPQRPGLVVASGGSGHAFKFMPLLGDIIANVVEGRPHCGHDRFAWREAQSGQEGARYAGDEGSGLA